MSDDSGQSNTSQVTSSVPSPSDIPLANPSDATWPFSTNLANGNQAPSSFGEILAKDSASPVESGLTPAPLAITPLQDQPSSPFSDSANTASEATPSASPISPQSPPPSAVPSEAPKEGSISESSSSDQPSQVPSSPSDNASTNTTSPNPPDLATIKPEPPQSSQSTPLANDIITPNPKSSSFGDILAQDSPIVEPTINIEPIVPPKPSSPVSPLPDDLSTEASAKVEASAKDGQPPLDTIILRQKANQKRLDKKQKNLDRIMLLIKETGTITNTDVQRLCRVSQSTATNYLTELEKKGLIRQTGIRGGAKYTL